MSRADVVEEALSRAHDHYLVKRNEQLYSRIESLVQMHLINFSGMVEVQREGNVTCTLVMSQIITPAWGQISIVFHCDFALDRGLKINRCVASIL